MEFEWDEAKAEANKHKHGVSFAETSTAFEDPLAAIFSDPEHSEDETREILIGFSERNRLLISSFTERNGKIRISARVATLGERKNHQENTNGGRA